MRLADDLMEPFRPMIDLRVWAIAQSECDLDVVPATKKMLVAVLNTDLPWEGTTSPVSVIMHHSSRALAEYFLAERSKLLLPGVEIRPGLEALAEAYS